jgi:FAD:protein FMN transferase
MRRARPLLGTFVDISVDGTALVDMTTAVEAAFAAVERVHCLMSFHDPDSDVSRLNRDAAAQAVAVDPWTHQVLAAAVDLNRRSNGLFDVTVASVLQRRGLLPGLPPPDATLAAPRDAIEMLPDRRIRFLHPGTRIDLGGIAKGFAVDRAVDVLRAHGVPLGVVDAGGDLAAFGPAAAPIHIRDPRDPRRAMACISIMDEALASSGGRFDPVNAPDVTTSAVVDTRTREPVRTIAGVTVRAPSCMLADALTKVLMSAGEEASALLDQIGAAALIVWADGEIRVSPSWQGACAA